MPGNLPHTAARQPVANFAGMFPTITQPRLLNTLPAPALNTNQPAGTTDKTDKTDKPVPIEKIIGITCAISIAATLIGIVVFYYAVIADTKVPSTTGATSSADSTINGLPKPLASQQNYVLAGSGKWIPSLMGSILQSVSTKRSKEYRPSTNWTTVPDLSVPVTPISADSKFLLTANITFSQMGIGATTTVFRFMRNEQPVGLGTGVPNQVVGSFRASPSANANIHWTAKATGDYLDAPATTSNITYTLQFMTFDAGRVVYFNGLDRDGINADESICISTLTVQQC
jgi:hypothetical protein